MDGPSPHGFQDMDLAGDVDFERPSVASNPREPGPRSRAELGEPGRSDPVDDVEEARPRP